ncbi:MAG: sulfotransferase domain-containing protein [Anaerolineales bacterium]|nr:sulfotransferase domain-containing protein [Anaerolineales bacterium]
MKLPSDLVLNTTLEDPDKKIYVVSYQNSGRTWLRSLLSRYKQLLLDVDGFHIKLHAYYSEQPYCPQFIFYHARSADIPDKPSLIKRLLGRREIVYDFDSTLYEKSRLLLLVRSPKDVMVSSYHELGSRQGLFKGSISEFIRDPRFGLERWIRFHNFMQSQRNLDDPKTLIVSYEELRSKTGQTLEEIIRFADFQVKTKWIADAIEFSSIENMRQLELSNKLIRPANTDASTNQSTRKVRSGIVGGYKNSLSAKDIGYIDETVKAQLSSYYLEHKFLS